MSAALELDALDNFQAVADFLGKFFVAVIVRFLFVSAFSRITPGFVQPSPPRRQPTKRA